MTPIPGGAVPIGAGGPQAGQASPSPGAAPEVKTGEQTPAKKDNGKNGHANLTPIPGGPVPEGG